MRAPASRFLLALLVTASLASAGCLSTLADLTGSKTAAGEDLESGSLDPAQDGLPVGDPPLAKMRVTADDGAVLYTTPPPDAIVAAVCTVVPQGNLTFTAEPSTPGTGANLTGYEWTLVPGGTRTEKNFTLPLTGPEGLTVTLKVTDSAGRSVSGGHCFTTNPVTFTEVFTFTGAIDAGIKGQSAFPPAAHAFTLPVMRNGWAVKVTGFTATLTTSSATADFALALTDAAGERLGAADEGSAGAGETLTLATLTPGDLQLLVSMTGVKGAYTLTVEALLEETFMTAEMGHGDHAGH